MPRISRWWHSDDDPFGDLVDPPAPNPSDTRKGRRKPPTDEMELGVKREEERLYGPVEDDNDRRI